MRVVCLVAFAVGLSARANAQGTVRTVKFQGNHSLEEKLLRASIATQQAPLFYRLSLTRWVGLAKAPPFDALEFRRDVLRIQALYGVHGFPEAKVDTVLRRKHDDLDITFRIGEGPPVIVDSVQLAGLDTLEQIPNLRSTLPIQPGNPKDTMVTVHVRAQLAEYPLRRARVSAGYGTLDCMRAMGSVDLFNFSGEGRRLEFRARTSELGVNQFDHSLCRQLLDEDTSRLKVNYNLAVTLHDPLLSWNRTTAMATVFFERHTEFGAYLREAVGGEVALTRQIATDLPLEGSYSLSYGKTLAAPATFCGLLGVCSLDDQAIFGARRRRSVVSLQLVRDRSNSINDPTQGSTLVTEVRVSPAFLGSNEFMRFVRATAGFTAHAPMGNGVFSWSVRAGPVFAPGSNLPSGRREYVPPEERLFAGGSTTIRGFSENQLGAVVRGRSSDGSIRTSATGGTFMALSNVEARVPMRLFGMLLFGAVFVDAGMVAERSHISLGDVRATPGAGLRMPSLLGPIRLDVGFNPYAATAGPLYDQVGNQLQLVDASFRPRLRLIDRFQLHLSIGQAF